MKFKYLIASAALIVGVAAYTLTLSFTETDLMTQLEALANNESGEGGGTGNENPESGGGKKRYAMNEETHHCQEYRWVRVSDGNGGYNWEKRRIGNSPKDVIVTTCVNGTELESCTSYDPCDPDKPTI